MKKKIKRIKPKKLIIALLLGALLMAWLQMRLPWRYLTLAPYQQYRLTWLIPGGKSYTQRVTAIATAPDKTGAEIIVAWRSYKPYKERELFEAITEALLPIAGQTLTKTEIDFVMHDPAHALHNSFSYLKQFLPPKTKKVDKQRIAKKITAEQIEQRKENPESPWRPNDRCIIITAHRQLPKKTNSPAEKKQKLLEPLGYARYIIKPENPEKATLDELAVIKKAQRLSLGALLTSSIYPIAPQIKKIEVFVRPTNIIAQAAYHSYGFIQNPITDPTCAKNWLLFIYDSSKNNFLQHKALSLHSAQTTQ